METTIKINVTGETMNFIFDNGLVNIRHFECENPNYDPKEKNIFEVKIRHNENENPKKLFYIGLIDAKTKISLFKNKDKKVKLLQNKVAKLTEKLTEEIQGICEMMNYKDSSIFSYNIDRLKQFNDGLQEF